jgi:hypothetical protein
MCSKTDVTPNLKKHEIITQENIEIDLGKWSPIEIIATCQH